MLLENLNVKWFTFPFYRSQERSLQMSIYQVSSQRVVKTKTTHKASTIKTKHLTPYGVATEVATHLLAGDNPGSITISTVPVAPLDNDAGTKTLKPKAVQA
jgi:hypothetical protein